MKTFVAVDGESYTEGTDHRYVLLAASTGRYAFNADGLSTVDCFKFLLDLPKTALKVGYGWNYDVNMILGDVDLGTLIRLWKEGQARWRGYRLEWIPSKWFAVRTSKRSVKIHEAFGFFQTSFVNALRKWDIDPPAEIESMKAQRSVFDSEMQRDVIEYCLEECRLLVQLMDELEIALELTGLNLSSWVGAGSIASALMRREGVKEHVVRDSEYGEDVYKAIRYAYFGGRSELFQQGEFLNLWDYDVSSAYPHAARNLPSLQGGKFRHVRRYDPVPDYALWRCSWDIPRSEIIMPFPFRASANRGDIHYPARGGGWYHAVEVRAAREIYGTRIAVEEGYVFRPATDERPFAFIPEMYEHRAQMKRDGHGGEKVLKLGMNAIYGKLAQGFGYKGKTPPFQSYFWAGAITADCRARILSLAAMNPDELVMIATDGIFFTSPLNVVADGGLGGLELTQLGEVFVAQPGVYSARDGDDIIGRSRGFFSREIDFPDLRRGFAERGCMYVGKYESTRFIGLGGALILRSTEHWRTWRTAERTLSLYPSRKFVDEGDNSNPVRHSPPVMGEGAFSEPYKPKQRGMPLAGDELDALVSYIQGAEQPLTDY